ncbi:MAG: oligopeptide ABC transporter permease AppB [Phototrophicaceae bacterium]
MTRHIIRRLIQSIPTLLGVTILSYLLMAAAPGDPIKQMTFGDPNMTPQTREALADRYGLNDPWYIQYLVYMTGNDWMPWKYQDGEFTEAVVRYGVLRGDFGTSITKRLAVTELIKVRLPATMELGLATFLVSIFVGIPVGIGAAVWQGKLFDNSSRILAVLGQAIPNFWLALLLLLTFGVSLDIDWARGGRCDARANRRTPCGQVPITQRLEYLIFPTLVLSLGGVAGYSRFMRTSMLDTINSDYIRTARAKGLNDRTVWFKHGARNALIPIATFLGPAVVGILGGAVIIERIFSWPGLGQLFLEAISQRDYPIVMASVIIGAVLTVIAYIISDILYAVFDPRIRF